MPQPPSQNDNLDPYTNDMLSSYIDEGEDGTLNTILGSLDEYEKSAALEKGGAGSGHFGHAGRPGERGGSMPGDGGGASAEGSVAGAALVEDFAAAKEGKLRGYLSAETWGDDFRSSVQKVIDDAREHLVVTPVKTREEMEPMFHEHTERFLKDSIKRVDTRIEDIKKDIKDWESKLEEDRKSFDAVYADPAKADERQRFERRIESDKQMIAASHEDLARYENLRQQFDKQGASTTLHVAVSTIVDELAKAKSITEQQEIMNAAHVAAVSHLNAKMRGKDLYPRYLADVYYSVIRNRHDQFNSYAADSIQGYLEKHYGAVLQQYENADDLKIRRARQAVEGKSVTRTIAAQKNFKEGKDRIFAMFSPELLSKVAPVNWAGKRGRGGRSWYKSQIQTIELARDDRPDTIPHEFAHHVEFQIPEIVPFFEGYYRERTQGETPRKLGAGYSSYERTKLDQWAVPYMGHYNESISHRREGGEIFSTAVGMMASPKSAALLYRKDPELFGITISILNGKIPQKRVPTGGA